MEKLIFLSHIHEEKDLAILIKNALEEEFGGFVDVFVSSDGISIPAGANFLKCIENGLLNCYAGLYLISPYSVNRNWINFELGAVWIRNKIANINKDQEIPTIPLCHSGLELRNLPQPINNLNAIQANLPGQLEFAFKSIQNVVGGKGKLRTDFNLLGTKIQQFEREYTLGNNLRKMFDLVNVDMHEIYTYIDKNIDENIFKMKFECVKMSVFDKLKLLEKNELKGNINHY